ncbi:MAG: protein-L-isoaspartate(D-aspartate) O-methyltransferase [Mollicutes bacterium]|nr:protein-L-isoaspartate(D-aspartate) O-methyltransferase [Mollicutes bacterium]
MNHQALIDFVQKLDRSKFIDNEFKTYAYVDSPLPIGYGQTISQPSLVLKMTMLLNLNKNCKVLEIGTGSGYQTALLAKFSKHVYTIELIPELSNKAKERLEKMGFKNITYLIGDGSIGNIEYAPYDRIIVTAAAKEIPNELLEQLNNDGIMIIPIGNSELQTLKLVKKDKDGKINIEDIIDVRFVEFKGRYGWNK